MVNSWWERVEGRRWQNMRLGLMVVMEKAQNVKGLV